jgi:hypothetical protein
LFSKRNFRVERGQGVVDNEEGNSIGFFLCLQTFSLTDWLADEADRLFVQSEAFGLTEAFVQSEVFVQSVIQYVIQ